MKKYTYYKFLNRAAVFAGLAHSIGSEALKLPGRHWLSRYVRSTWGR